MPRAHSVIAAKSSSQSLAVHDVLTRALSSGCQSAKEHATVARHARSRRDGTRAVASKLNIRRQTTGATATKASAIGAMAVGVRAIGPSLMGPLACGAVAIGAIAIGRLAIADAVIKRLRAEEIEIASLKVGRLEVAGQSWTGSSIPQADTLQW
jgi:hypothetical protein